MTDQKQLSDIRILIVDDEPFIREVLVRILKQIGIQHVVEAFDGSDGLTKISSANPDLIILDIMMEPMNGLQFLKTLRIGLSDAAFDMPVMVLTGADDEAILGAAMSLDCDAFVKKNVGPEAIQQRIERVLSQKAALKEASSYHSIEIPDVIMDMPSPDNSELAEPSDQAQEVPAMEIKQGMIVDRDFHTADGFLLLAKDTEITASHVGRVSDLAEILSLETVWVRYS